MDLQTAFSGIAVTVAFIALVKSMGYREGTATAETKANRAEVEKLQEQLGKHISEDMGAHKEFTNHAMDRDLHWTTRERTALQATVDRIADKLGV